MTVAAFAPVVTVAPPTPEPCPNVTFAEKVYPGETGYWELRTFAPEGTSPAAVKRQQQAKSLREFVRIEQGVVKEPQKVIRFVRRCKVKRFNAYFAVALRSEEGAKTQKGNAEHCQVLTALFVDLDFKYREDGTIGEEDGGEAHVRQCLSEFPVPPSFTVESGSGIHAHWGIPPIYLKAKGQYPLAKHLLSTLANHFKGVADVQVSQPAAVLRLPDTLNYKYDPPRLTRFVAGTG